jgi:hypothetical protein
MQLRSVAAVAAVATALATSLTACHSEPGERRPTPRPDRSQLSLPADAVTVLPDDEPGSLAIRVSQALYDRAPVVVLAGADDPAGQREAAATAVDLGVPLLLTPPAGDSATAAATPTAGAATATAPATDAPDPDRPGVAALRDELARLGSTTVLAIGDGPARWGQRLGDGVEVVPAGPGRPTGAPEVGDLTPPAPLRSLTVLAAETARTLAALATARAAGARVLATTATDPRADPAVIAALADRPPSHTLALGAGFGPVDRLRDRLAVAATGVELPGGGQRLFPGRRFVALYGHPGDPVLGVLGEQPVGETIARARRVAADYQRLVDEPVVPALEIITTVASAGPGPAGDYSRRTPPERLRPWLDAAREAGVYVVLDLQPGRTDFLSQAKEYERLLTQPHVGLALDPEWRLAPDQRHMVQIGSVDAAEVNRVVAWLADLTARHRLPQKLLVLHQFTLQMITNRGEVDTGRDELAVLIHADGFGTPGQKLQTWDALHANAPEGVWWGWKNFYDEDRPTFTPGETVAVEPSPRFVSYQ